MTEVDKIRERINDMAYDGQDSSRWWGEFNNLLNSLIAAVQQQAYEAMKDNKGCAVCGMPDNDYHDMVNNHEFIKNE